jgi:RNA polymerase sigma-70 factor (ECF subfamily)
MSEPRVSAEVIEACARGDRRAFTVIFEAYKDRIYSTVLLFFGGKGDVASDVTQEVFIKVWSKIGQYRGDAGFGTWLYRMVASTCADEHRRRQRREFSLDPERSDEAILAAAAAESPDGSDMARAVHRAVAGLRPKLKIAILLKYFEGLSYEEMARALGCSKGTVASRLNRGHRILAQRLGRLKNASSAGGSRC